MIDRFMDWLTLKRLESRLCNASKGENVRASVLGYEFHVDHIFLGCSVMVSKGFVVRRFNRLNPEMLRFIAENLDEIEEAIYKDAMERKNRKRLVRAASSMCLDRIRDKL